jgi:very-short-patch-repair endonuclease
MKKHHNNFYNKDLLLNARELRSEKSTKGERRLWKSVLCKKQAPVRFLRQRPIDQFIVDFFAPTIGLIIEIDGNSHYHNAKYDIYRLQKLQKLGYTILRFNEGAVLNQLDDVTTQILHAIHCQHLKKQ